ncbi:pentapeptide repeat-containing protein [Rhodococcus erythropolis]|nr:pentapeptide repeat-containing protein [Rhodococcus erythropolis]
MDGRSDFSGAVLRGADLSGANVYQANWGGPSGNLANLSGAKWGTGDVCAEGSYGRCNF